MEYEEVISYSKGGYSVEYDHEKGCLDILENGEYKVNSKYKDIYQNFKKKYYLDNNYTHLKNNTHSPLFSLLYRVYIEDPENFDSITYDVMELNYEEDLRDVWLVISDCLKDSFSSNSTTYKLINYFANRFEVIETSKFINILNKVDLIREKSRQTNLDIDLLKEKMINMISKPHWKDTQSIEDKEKRLKAAEEKRQRKLAKGKNNNG